jgi:methyl-accepting chemotaxis protein
LKKGQTYVGKANVVGVWNQTAYEPIKNTHGDIIGMFYVGVPNTHYDQVAKDISTKIILSSILGLLIVIAPGIFLTNSITRPLNRIIEGLTDGADQVASASSQVSTASQSLAEGASEQAAGLEETSSSIEEMASMTKQNEDNANQANTLMVDTSRVVDEANHSMTESTQSMNEISTASEETGKIIKTIDEIAFQTNLLALNAAVEAARAGEAGAGFAVVANEVKNLAMRAAEAAKNTANLIEGTVKRIQSGSEIVSKTNEAFGKVATGSKKVGQLVGEISAASQEQAQGIEQVNRAVAEMDKVVQKNAASAEESASASEEMNTQAEQMKDFVGELVMLVSGSSNGNGMLSQRIRGYNGGDVAQVSGASHQPKAGVRKVLSKAKAVRPDQVIPMEEADSKEF